MDTPAVSETVSRKRGRPRLLDADMEAFVGAPLLQAGRCARTVRNQILASQVVALKDDPACAWLFKHGGQGRQMVWVELGRLAVRYSQDALLELARWVCSTQPKSGAEAIRTLREWKVTLQNGGSCPGSAQDLLKALIRTVNQFRRKHPGTPFETVMEAAHLLRTTTCEVEPANPNP